MKFQYIRLITFFNNWKCIKNSYKLFKISLILCVVLVGLYGKELKLNRNKTIKLNKEFHGFVDEDDEPEFIESDLGDLILIKVYYDLFQI